MNLEILNNFLYGFQQAITFQNVIYCFIGSFLGTLVGVLPGIGANTALALIFPLVFYLPFPSSIIMLIAMYYGCQYGGSTSAILTKIAGEISSIPTIDQGNLLAKNGKAGVALSISAISSFFAGILNALFICFFILNVSEYFLKFGPREYVCLGILSIIGSILMSDSRHIICSIGVSLFGILLGLIGFDITTGEKRFTFNILDLYDGVGVITFTLGIFALSEVFKNNQHSKIKVEKIDQLYPSKKEIIQSINPTIRGTLIGTVVGLIPGISFLSSFISYTFEKHINKNFVNSKKGAIEGVAGPEAANNASSQSSLIPVLTIGIPVNTSTALILVSLTIGGFIPGPQFITQSFSIFWILISSIFIGNIILLVLNLPLIKLWTYFLKLNQNYINYTILLVCCLSVYNINNSFFEVFLLVIFAIFGYFLFLLKIDSIPLITGFILGPIIEDQFRRHMSMTNGDYFSFFYGEINIIFMTIFTILFGLTFYSKLKNKFINI